MGNTTSGFETHQKEFDNPDQNSKQQERTPYIAPSGFRRQISNGASDLESMNTLKPQEIVDILSEIEELQKEESDDDDDDTELLIFVREIAHKHGIINGDFDYIKKQNMITDISLKFTYGKQLGDGASCRVLLVHENATQTKYALKEMIIDNKHNPTLFMKEIRILTELDHPHILKYHQCYMDPHNFYIATQYCYGGDLYKRCKQYKTFTERIASLIIHTIIDAVAYMHKKGIVHRDLKPSNIVFDKPGPNGQLFIIDFGDSERVEDDEMYNEFVGTIYYLPPEITRYRHGWELKKGDTWSIGVITYQLLCGRYPFYGHGNRKTMARIKKGEYGWPSDVVLSKYAKRFIRALLKKNVHARLSASDALKNEWFAMAYDTDLGEAFSKTMDDVAKAARLRYIVKNQLFSEMDEEEMELMRDTFKAIDVEKKEYITQKQIEKFLMAKAHLKEKYAKLKAMEFMLTFDVGNKGKLTFDNLAHAKHTL
eukprot:172868_1